MSLLTGKLPNVRQMYCAAPGRKLVHADWSQVEPRLISIIAPDKKLAEDIAVGDNGGEDLYQVQARDYFAEARKKLGLPANYKIKKEERRSAKVVHLGSQYAAVTRTVYEQALRQMPDLKWGTCKVLHDKWKKRYHGVVEYWFKEHAKVLKLGYSESCILHRRKYYADKPEISKTANYPIQATASDICNICFLQVCDKVEALAKETDKFAEVITNFYDAIDVECDDELVQDVMLIEKETMEQEFEINGARHRFPVKVTSGQLWSKV